MTFFRVALLGILFSGCDREPDPSPAQSFERTAHRHREVVVADPSPPLDTQVEDAPQNSILPTYELKIDNRDLMALENGYGRDTHPATFLAEGKTYNNVKVRTRGAWSRSWPKKSLKIFFDDNQPFGEFHTLNLNSGWRDPAFIREPLAYQIYGLCGAPTLKSRMVRLNANGQFRGLYVEIEQPEKAFLKRLNLKGAIIYKTGYNSTYADERDHGSEQAFAAHYTQETQKKTPGFQDLQQFCHALAQTSNAREFFEKNVDLEKYINFLAATVLVQNWDTYNKNHFLVYDARGARKWFVVPWDLDRTLGDHWNWSFSEARLPILLGTRQRPGITGWNRLQDRFFSDQVLKNRFLERLELLLNTVFTTEKIFPILDRWETEINTEAQLDRRRWPNRQASDLHDAIEGVKSFIEERRAYLLRELPKLR